MSEFFDVIDSGATPLRQVVLSVVSAYLMSHAIAALYAWTRRGQEQSPNFVKALVIGGIVGAMIMLAIGNSLARGVGIVGALALIRFRTNLRDPLDMVFIFAAFAAGIAAGAGNIETGFVGTAIFLVVVLVMHISSGGSSGVEADLRVRIMGDGIDAEAAIRAILREQTNGFAVLKRRSVGTKDKPKNGDKAPAVSCDVVVHPAPEPTGDQTPKPREKEKEKGKKNDDGAEGGVEKEKEKEKEKDKLEQRLMYRVVLHHTDDEGALGRALAHVPGVVEVALSLDSATPGSTAGGDDD